jgi:RHH-type rel operon transcriptional repressor/antitoxin RelB
VTKEVSTMSAAISIRLPEELVKKLDKLASVTERPKAFLIREAIETYLNEYSDYRMALDRLLDKDDEIIESSELRRKLGL